MRKDKCEVMMEENLSKKKKLIKKLSYADLFSFWFIKVPSVSISL